MEIFSRKLKKNNYLLQNRENTLSPLAPTVFVIFLLLEKDSLTKNIFLQKEDMIKPDLLFGIIFAYVQEYNSERKIC